MTAERPPPPADLPDIIPNPGLPRANVAISRENPEGLPGTDRKDLTVLQQHVMFWDRDNDGVIWPNDTFVGFRRLGYPLPLCVLAVPFIHTLAFFTSPTLIPNPLAPFHMKYAHRAKHGSDTGVYDTAGRFVPERFEEMFAAHDRDNKGGMTLNDLMRMCQANTNAMDPAGGLATRVEWYFTWLLLKDEQGVVAKDKIRGVYDGSVFYRVADEVEASKKGRTTVKL